MLPYRKDNRGRNRKIKSFITPRFFKLSTALQTSSKNEVNVASASFLHIYLLLFPAGHVKKGVKTKYKNLHFQHLGTEMVPKLFETH